MTATLHEVIGGLGLWQLELDWDADLVKKLVRGSILRLYDGQRKLYTGILLSRTPAEKALTIAGQGLDWLLGVGDSGPLIESREYLACTDKLANGDFSLGDLYYRFGQSTFWAIGDAGPATVSADSTSDDVLESDEVFPALPGQQYRLTVIAKRNAGAIGRLRGRIIYEGRFSPPNLVSDGDFEGDDSVWGTATYLSIVADAHARTGSKVLRVDPIPQPDAMVDGDFEGDPTAWTVVSNTLLDPVSEIINDPSRARSGSYVLLVGTTKKRAFAKGDMEAWTGSVPDGWADISLAGPGWTQSSTSRSGSSSARSEPGTAAGLQAFSPPENVAGDSSTATRAAESERWRFTGFVANDIVTPADGHAWAHIFLLKDDLSIESSLPTRFMEPQLAFTWQVVQQEFVFPAGYSRMRTFLFASNIHGYWYWDDVTLERIAGNEEILSSTAMTVAPGEEWLCTVHARSGAAFLSGGLFPRVRIRGVKTVTTKALTSNVATLTTSVAHGFEVGQVVQVLGVDSTFNGSWTLTAVTPTTLSYALTHADIGSTGATGTVGNPDILSELPPVSQTNNQWITTAKTVSVPDGYDTAIVELRGRDIEGEWIYVDDISFVRTAGNSDSITHDPIALIPGRTYQLKAQIRSGPNATGPGTVNLVGTYSAPGRDDITFEATQEATGDAYQELALGIAPPSGYDSFTLAVKAQDILGDSWWVDDITLVDRTDPISATDLHTKTYVEDVVVSATGLATYTHDSTAPDGTQKVQVQLLVESDGAGWEVDEWHLQRIGTPATVGEIVADLAKDENGTQLIALGTVYDPTATIAHDWQITNLHNRDALVHLLSGGVAADLREYRVDADGSLSVGTAEELYADRTDLVLTAFDIVVTEPPDATTDDTDYFSHVKVIGAQRQTANGDTVTIDALVAVPWTSPLLDAAGNAIRRTKVVTDSSVNHPLYAQALASSIANDMAARQSAVPLAMSDLRPRGNVSVGDWIYPYVPEAGLVDRTNPQPAQDGSTAFPEKIRIVERLQRLGDGYRALVTPPGGDEIDITESVRWEDMTSADITVGTFVPSFTVDDQGGAAVKQFLRYRASAAR